MKTKLNKRTVSLKAAHLITGGAFCLSAGMLQADALEETITEIFSEGKANIDVRARFETREVGAAQAVDSFNIRTRVGFTTGKYYGFKAMVELEDISAEDDTKSADAVTTELNQLWLGYYQEDFHVKVGRQIFTLDDHRFIGHVGWRQNIQTFDAVTAATTIIPDTVATFGFLDSVNRVTATSEDLNGFLFNVNYKMSKAFNLVGYAYLLDFDGAPLASTDTFGFTAKGTVPVTEEFSFSYVGSYAFQDDNSGSFAGTDYDNDYYDIKLKGHFMGFTVGLGYEVLEGNGTNGFSTPLATVHKFAGYADVFLGPTVTGGLTNGLVDQYVEASYKIPVGNGIAISASYHLFETDENSEDLGDELDIVVAYPINKYLKLVSKYANYKTDNPTTVGYGAVDNELFTFELNFKY